MYEDLLTKEELEAAKKAEIEKIKLLGEEYGI